MTKEDQATFVKLLTNRVILQEILEKIESDQIPESWDGIELRWYLAEMFGRITYTASKKRKSNYDNDVIVNNL
jgi:hypothetical protein